MPILPLFIERFNNRKLLFVLTLEEYKEQDYLSFFIDDQNQLWFALGNDILPIEELPAIPLIALYSYLPAEVREVPEYQHVPMIHLITDYLKMVFGKGIAKI